MTVPSIEQLKLEMLRVRFQHFGNYMDSWPQTSGYAGPNMYRWQPFDFTFSPGIPRYKYMLVLDTN